jgi:U3 small nucleolar RNA-associated protein 15
MTDGTLAVRRRDPKANEEATAEAKQAALAGGSYEVFAEMETIFGTGHIKARGKNLPGVVGPADEFKVENKRKVRLREFDRFLKAFKYGSALDAGLKKVSSSLPVQVGSVS